MRKLVLVYLARLVRLGNPVTEASQVTMEVFSWVNPVFAENCSQSRGVSVALRQRLIAPVFNRLQDDCCKGFFDKTFWLITFLFLGVEVCDIFL